MHFVFFIFFLKPAALFPGGLAARCLCCNFLYCIIRPVVWQVLPLVFVIVVQKSGKTARRKAGLGSDFFGGLPAVCAQPGGRQMGVRRRHGSLTELCCHGGGISHGRSRKKAWSCLPPIAFLPPPHYNSQYNQSSAPKSAFASLRRSGQREGRASRPDLNG